MPDTRAKHQFHVCPECGEQRLLWDPQCQLYLCHNNQCAASMKELPREEAVLGGSAADLSAQQVQQLLDVQAAKIESQTKALAQMRAKRDTAVRKIREADERHEKAKSEIARLNRALSRRDRRGVANA